MLGGESGQHRRRTRCLGSPATSGRPGHQHLALVGPDERAPIAPQLPQLLHQSRGRKAARAEGGAGARLGRGGLGDSIRTLGGAVELDGNGRRHGHPP